MLLTFVVSQVMEFFPVHSVAQLLRLSMIEHVYLARHGFILHFMVLVS
jgi:hypothetical protein